MLHMSRIITLGTWTVDALSTQLSSNPSSIRKHLGYWVGQGVLREDSNDTFTVIEKRSEKTRGPNIGTPLLGILKMEA